MRRRALTADMHPLEEAAIAVRDATDGYGLKIILMPSMDIFSAQKVRQKICEMSQWFADDAVFMSPDGHIAAARNLALLANLLVEILKERTAVAA